MELREAVASGAPDQIEAELGDVLFAAVNVARFTGVRPELALRGTVDRFLSRFAHMEETLSRSGRAISDASFEELDALWEEAKAGSAS